MNAKYHAFVWIDHRLAKVFHFDEDAYEIDQVHSSQAHQHLHHKANSIASGHAPVDQAFLERVVEAVGDAGAILIAGPGTAKTELHTHIKRRHARMAGKISAIESLDHPTDGQLLAHARRFFHADDRMRRQV
jgi:stalled ribosome rescue protein Dom34